MGLVAEKAPKVADLPSARNAISYIGNVATVSPHFPSPVQRASLD
jgi:hypothetical protein